nr:WXG100 family type VII secretion target [Amycolatopsis sp. CA-230715]
MLQAGDAATARTAAQRWQATATGLHDQAGGLTDELHGFEDGWRGGAADKYRTMITDLAGGIRKVAHTASAMRDLLEDAADDLDKAKAEMPPPVDVPAVSPSDISLAATPPLLPADASQEVVMAAARQRATAISAVRSQQQAAATANAAHDKAVAVMTTLATGYTATEQAIPAAPDAAEVPGAPRPGGSPGAGHGTGEIPGGGTAVVPGDHPLAPADGGTAPGGAAPGGTKPASPLFGDMFTAGLAAASAAAFGRFGSIMPKVPGWAGKKPEERKDKDTVDTAVTGGAGGGIPDAASGSGGVGGLGGLDGGAIGGGAGLDGTVPAAHTGLSGSTGAGGALSGLAGGAAGAAGAAAAKSAMPMMPFMPMGMGAGELGSGRRIPPWLVETEDVWGESSAVAPPVIGTEPDHR